MSERRSWVPVLAVVGLAAFLYCRNLGGAPIYLGGDEAHFGVQGHSIASTGRDLSGHVMPLFFNLSDPLGDSQSVRWYQPALFYLSTRSF
jgi:hypothetical protein